MTNFIDVAIAQMPVKILYLLFHPQKCIRICFFALLREYLIRITSNPCIEKHQVILKFRQRTGDFINYHTLILMKIDAVEPAVGSSVLVLLADRTS